MIGKQAQGQTTLRLDVIKRSENCLREEESNTVGGSKTTSEKTSVENGLRIGNTTVGSTGRYSQTTALLL